MLTAKNIGMRIGMKHLLSGIDFSVKPGEVLAILGPNGAGKSTLLRILSGEIAPTEGSVLLDDIKVRDWDCRELACRRAVLSQFTGMHMPFRALDIVVMGRSPHSHNSSFSKDHSIALLAMEMTDSAQLADRTMDTLSGGEQQRVHWARVLAQIWEPQPGGNRYLLLDEPISSLDIAHQHAALALAGKMAAQGVAVTVILHDLNIASQYADRLLLLAKGRMISFGNPSEVLTEDALRQAFEIESAIRFHPLDDSPCVFVSRDSQKSKNAIDR